jgi:hypothetical protein
LTDDDQPVTHRELELILAKIDQQFKAQFNKILLVMGLAVGFIKVDTPKEAGALALLLAAAKIMTGVVFRS